LDVLAEGEGGVVFNPEDPVRFREVDGVDDGV
jgi:hypothetical protein